MENSKLKYLLSNIFKNTNVYFFTIDNLFRKVIIFSWEFILMVSFIRWAHFVKNSRLLYFDIIKFDDINNIYKQVFENEMNNSISYIISTLIKYESIIYNLFYDENQLFFENNFTKMSNTNKNFLFVLKWWGFEEIIEKYFIAYCNYNNIDLTVLYKFWLWFWWQQLNQDGYINELRINNPKVKFIYKEDFNDDYIDSITDNKTEIFSLKYYYRWKSNNFNLLIDWSLMDNVSLDSIEVDNNVDIDCSWYKNIFTCYNKQGNIWYTTDTFMNYKNTNLHRCFLPQDIDLINNYKIYWNNRKIIISWWMSWARDFSVLNLLKWKYNWILISDELHDISGFLGFHRWIQNYYAFLWAIKTAYIWVFCHLEEYNNDDRTKMIITTISFWIPVIVPYNDWLLVKAILENKLGISYNNIDYNDFVEKVDYFMNNELIVNEYSKNCLEYSKNNFNVINYVNNIFGKTI